MPGDKYKFNVEYFTRTQPVETSAYTRLREYFDFYAVPLRLLWKSAPSVLTQMQDINQIQSLSLTQNLSLGTYLPSLPLNVLSLFLYRLNGSTYNPGSGNFRSNMFGFNRGDLSFKLLSYLGYGNFISTVPSSNNRWWSTSLKNTDDAADYTQQYIQNNYVMYSLFLLIKRFTRIFSVGLSGKMLTLLPIMWIIFLVFLLLLFLMFLLRILIIGNLIQCLTLDIVTGIRIC